MRRIGLFAVTVLLAACGTGKDDRAARNAALEGEPLAVFDPALRVPACASPQAECASGALLAARGDFEANSPNTLDGCRDTSGWVAGEDESIEAIRVRTLDGSPLQESKTVEVEVDVVAAPGYPANERLFLFRAPDVTAPKWTIVGTALVDPIPPPTPGPKTYTFQVPLQPGGFQAIRASYHWAVGTNPDVCGLTEGDVDDLAFAVLPGPTDVTPPTVAIAAPANGATVSGTVTLEAVASDDVAMDYVRFVVDGVTGLTNDREPPYLTQWNTATWTPGPHTLVAEARDWIGNVATSAPVTVIIPDAVPPSVQLVSPSQGDFVRGVVSVTAQATDPNGVAGAELWVGLPQMTVVPNTYVAGLAAPEEHLPWLFTIPWDTAGLPTGRYYFEVRAGDAFGNFGSATTWAVVDNDAPVLALTSPLDGATVRGNVTIAATATDTYLKDVAFYVDGALLVTDTSAPFSASWNTKKQTGTVVVSAVATDLAGNTTTSAVTVTVR